MPAPKLEPHCGSWIIVQWATRDAVRETFSQTLADRIADNEPQFEVMTTQQWLAEFNQSTKEAT